MIESIMQLVANVRGSSVIEIERLAVIDRGLSLNRYLLRAS